jgi:hypothetical protein
MAHLGKGVNEKHFTKVSNYLTQWLGSEEIIALFMNNRMKPQIDGLVLTNKRILTISGLRFGDIKVVDEIAADDALKFTFEKGFGKIIRSFVEKKYGEKVYVGMVGADAPELNSFLSSMHGAPQSIAEMQSLAKNAESDAKRQVAAKKAQEDKASQARKKEEHQAVKTANKVAKQERKAAEVARVEARGKKLGYVFVKYIGGYGPHDKKTFFEGFLNCYENEVEYKDKDIAIPASQIVSFEITGKEHSNARLSVTRMVTLGVFSLAAPKRSTKKEASIYIGLKDGRRLMFQTNSLTESDVHRKLANAISRYSSLQASQSSHQQSVPTQTIDVAGEIARFADLRKQGILTDDEFEAKKKQLLNM